MLTRWQCFMLSCGLTLLSLTGCGTMVPTCGPSTCTGCCAADGQCVQLGSDSACGRGGALCRSCVAGETCSFGSCMQTMFGAGGGSSGVGGGSSGGGTVGGGSSGGLGGGSGGGAAGGTAGGGVFCGPSTCAGCCRSDGSCNLAPTTQSCGSQGQLCRDCQALGQQCSPATFSCTGGAGGGAAGGSAGGSAGGAAGGNPNDTRLRIFVTSTAFTGDLGGLAGADQRCQTAATAANKGGTWLAFLATSTMPGASRLTASGPWFQERVGGTFTLTYNNVANLQTGALATLNTDEQGRSFSFSPVTFWTGMNSDGTSSSNSCAGWTSTSSLGTVGAGTVLNAGGSTSCINDHSLLCLEQSRLPRPGPSSPVRKRVFVTSTRFTGNLGGLAGADQRCQTAAAAANKGGTWLAFLATSTVPGPSRFTTGGPWFQERSGGTFTLTYNNAANLQTSALATLNTDEQGRSFSFSPVTFWTGMNSDGTSSGNSCAGWTSTSSLGTVGAGSVLNTGGSTSCVNDHSLLCLEQ